MVFKVHVWLSQYKNWSTGCVRLLGYLLRLYIYLGTKMAGKDYAKTMSMHRMKLV